MHIVKRLVIGFSLIMIMFVMITECRNLYERVNNDKEELINDETTTIVYESTTELQIENKTELTGFIPVKIFVYFFTIILITNKFHLI